MQDKDSYTETHQVNIYFEIIEVIRRRFQLARETERKSTKEVCLFSSFEPKQQTAKGQFDKFNQFTSQTKHSVNQSNYFQKKVCLHFLLVKFSDTFFCRFFQLFE